MTNLITLLVVFGFLVAISVVSVLLIHRRKARKKSRQLAGVISTAIADAQAEVEQLREIIDRERQRADGERKRADGYFQTIESTAAEAASRMALYQRLAAEHANAQDMMMREIARVGAAYDRLRKAVLSSKSLEEAKKSAEAQLKVNPILRRVAAEFVEHHQTERRHTESNPVA